MVTGYEVQMYANIGRIADALERLSPRDAPKAHRRPPEGEPFSEVVASVSAQLRELSGRLPDDDPGHSTLMACCDRWDEFVALYTGAEDPT